VRRSSSPHNDGICATGHDVQACSVTGRVALTLSAQLRESTPRSDVGQNVRGVRGRRLDRHLEVGKRVLCIGRGLGNGNEIHVVALLVRASAVQEQCGETHEDESSRTETGRRGTNNGHDGPSSAWTGAGINRDLGTNPSAGPYRPKSQTRRDSNPRPLPPEGMGRTHESEVMPLFPGQSESGEVPKGAVRRSKAQTNPARCRVHSDAEALALALRRAIRVV
jgi:hypothetical protein